MTTRARPRKRAAAAPTIVFTGGKMRVRMSEDDLLRQVIKMCAAMGLMTLHIRTSRRAPAEGDENQRQRWETPVQGDGKGFPDLLIAGGYLMFRELKSDTGRLHPEQKRWLDHLAANGEDVGVWTPEDLHSGKIKEELLACRAAMMANRRQAAGGE